MDTTVLNQLLSRTRLPDYSFCGKHVFFENLYCTLRLTKYVNNTQNMHREEDMEIELCHNVTHSSLWSFLLIFKAAANLVAPGSDILLQLRLQNDLK